MQGGQGGAESREDVVRVISSWVSGALSDFRERDLDLLRYSVGEWSCAFRIAVYLEQRVDPTWRVDIEYNKQGVDGAPKRQGLEPDAPTMRPDIILHRRGSPAVEDNLLLLEIKKLWVPGGDRHDLAKIREVVTGGREFQYQFAAAIGLRDNEDPDSRFNPTWTLVTAGRTVIEEERIPTAGRPRGTDQVVSRRVDASVVVNEHLHS